MLCLFHYALYAIHMHSTHSSTSFKPGYHALPVLCSTYHPHALLLLLGDIYTLELDSRGSRVSRIILFLICASMSAYTTDHQAPWAPNKLAPLMVSRDALHMPMELRIKESFL